MKLILVDDRLDFRQIEDLMANRFGAGGLKLASAFSAGRRNALGNGGALRGWYQRTDVLLVTMLSALLSLFSSRRLSFRLGMRMLGAWRQRRVARREFLNLIGELLNLSFQLHDSLNEHRRKGFDSGCHFRFDFRRNGH